MKKVYLIMGEVEGDHLYKWAIHLNRYYDVYCLTFTRFTDNFYKSFKPDHLYNLGLEINSSGGNYHTLKSVFKIRNIIRKLKPDFVNSHYLTSYGLIGSIIKKLPHKRFTYIASAWGSDILLTPKRNKLFLYALKFTLRNADIITSDSLYMTNEVLKFENRPENIIYFPFGLDEIPDASYDDKDENLYYSNRAHKPLYCIDKVIKLFERYHQENCKATLIIANTGEQEDNLKNLVNELNLADSVKFIGYQDKEKQKELYKHATYYFSLPTSDSTSVSLLEAMSYGCIPIVSNIPANLEWIKEGENGIIVYEKLNASRLLTSRAECFELNREIIYNKALFPKSIAEFVSFLEKQGGNSL